MSHSDSTLLSIIIPTLNEEENLPLLLADLREQQNIRFEIIIGDGGSTDATRAIAEAGGAAFVSSPRGRGRQMNAASLKAGGGLLLFLHADSRIDNPLLLSDAVNALIAAQSETDRIAGHFRIRFIRTSDLNTVAYRYAEEKTAFNRVNTTNGDQGLLLSCGFFRYLGGFDESMTFLEDQRIAEKIRIVGEWITLPGYLQTSARRFETEGFHRRYILMSMIMGLHSVGAEEFFTNDPAAYQVQQETGTLYLSPFFALIWRMMRVQWGIRGSIRIFYLLGKYIRQNSWQMFYYCDVRLRTLLGRERYPLLYFHDRVFAPCTDFRVCNALTGLLCLLWFMGVLAPFFWVVDYKRINDI